MSRLTLANCEERSPSADCLKFHEVAGTKVATFAQSFYRRDAVARIREDRAVALRWEPVTASPEYVLTPADGIKPVRYVPRRKDLGSAPCPATATPAPAVRPSRKRSRCALPDSATGHGLELLAADISVASGGDD